MCLIVNTSFYKRGLPEKIIVYKVLYNCHTYIAFSSHMDYSWIGAGKGVEFLSSRLTCEQTKLAISHEKRWNSIYYGFHVYTKLSEAKANMGTNTLLVEFTGYKKDLIEVGWNNGKTAGAVFSKLTWNRIVKKKIYKIKKKKIKRKSIKI